MPRQIARERNRSGPLSRVTVDPGGSIDRTSPGRKAIDRRSSTGASGIAQVFATSGPSARRATS
ncbi:MAG: hypothetical protein QXG65_06110 [Thermoplasmata archaeon]